MQMAQARQAMSVTELTCLRVVLESQLVVDVNGEALLMEQSKHVVRFRQPVVQ